MKSAPFMGESMKPLLTAGDEVLFIDEDIDVIHWGDVVLFKSPDDEELIVHRVFQLEPLMTKGDWSCRFEEIQKDWILGKVIGYKRNGIRHYFKPHSFFLNLHISLSKLLLCKVSPIRWVARTCLLINRSFLS